MKKILFFILSFTSLQLCFAQKNTANIKGRVLNGNGEMAGLATQFNVGCGVCFLSLW
jgi:hypothetical protein